MGRPRGRCHQHVLPPKGEVHIFSAEVAANPEGRELVQRLEEVNPPTASFRRPRGGDWSADSPRSLNGRGGGYGGRGRGGGRLLIPGTKPTYRPPHRMCLIPCAIHGSVQFTAMHRDVPGVRGDGRNAPPVPEEISASPPRRPLGCAPPRSAGCGGRRAWGSRRRRGPSCATGSPSTSATCISTPRSVPPDPSFSWTTTLGAAKPRSISGTVTPAARLPRCGPQPSRTTRRRACRIAQWKGTMAAQPPPTPLDDAALWSEVLAQPPEEPPVHAPAAEA